MPPAALGSSSASTAAATLTPPAIVAQSASATGTWTDICALDDILPNTGACALIRGQQIAVVRVGDQQTLYAISNYDPFSKAFVLSRGIVGDRNNIPKIASPIYKQSFDLRNGQCLDDASVCVPIFPVRVSKGRVSVQC